MKKSCIIVSNRMLRDKLSDLTCQAYDNGFTLRRCCRICPGCGFVRITYYKKCSQHNIFALPFREGVLFFPGNTAREVSPSVPRCDSVFGKHYPLQFFASPEKHSIHRLNQAHLIFHLRKCRLRDVRLLHPPCEILFYFFR